MDQPLATAPGDASLEDAGKARRRFHWIAAIFYLACGVSGAFAAVLVALVFRDALGEPIGLLLAASVVAGVVTTWLLYQLGKQRLCDRAIVMGGGLASALMCSMMFLD
jgi:uncharacterized membrane protein YhaH (DUF805 family)